MKTPTAGPGAAESAETESHCVHWWDELGPCCRCGYSSQEETLCPGHVGISKRKRDALATSMRDLHVLALSVSDGTMRRADAQAQRAEICTRHGPAAVRALDDFYETRMATIKAGSRSYP